MKVLVTGSGGFIGSNLSERLERDGHMVFGFDLKSGQDLKNFGQIRRVLRETQPEVIFHLAATPGVRYSQEHPAECIGNNVVGTFNLLEALRGLDLDARVVFAGSSSIYATKSDPVDEDDETDPLSIYPSTKICCENLLTAYYKCYGLPIVLLRYFSVYGPLAEKCRPDMLIPKTVMLVSGGRSPVVYGDGEQTRDFTYISDAVDGTILASEKKQAIGKKVNIGSGVSHSVNSVVDQVVRLFPEKGVKPVYKKMELKERRHVCADISKAKRLLGYKPKISLDQGLRKFVEYYKKVAL